MARGLDHYGGVSRRNVSTRKGVAKNHVFSLAYSLIKLLRDNNRPEELKSDAESRFEGCPKTDFVVVAIAKGEGEVLLGRRCLA